MSLAQQLLLRALVARFWQQPYRAAALAARWGTELHDRFMLPTFVQMDVRTTSGEMANSATRSTRDWFAPHFEFRFPLVGEIAVRGVESSCAWRWSPGT